MAPPGARAPAGLPEASTSEGSEKGTSNVTTALTAPFSGAPLAPPTLPEPPLGRAPKVVTVLSMPRSRALSKSVMQSTAPTRPARLALRRADSSA